VFVLPVGGFGWNRLDIDAPAASISKDPQPLPFNTRLLEFYRQDRDIKAVVGIIDTPEHVLNGYWAAFCIRDGHLKEKDEGKMFFNFTSRPGKYNVRIGTQKPRIQIDYSRPIPEWMDFPHGMILDGLAYVAESALPLQEIIDRINRPPPS